MPPLRRLLTVAVVVALAAAAAPSLARPAAATTLGLVLPDQPGEGAERVAKAAEASAADRAWLVERRDGAGIADLVQRKVDALALVMVRPEQQAAGVDLARRAGIPVVTVLAGASPLAALDVTVNPYAAGASIGAYLLGSIGYQGRVILVRQDADPAAKARGRVVDLMLQDAAPGVQVTGSIQRAAGAGWEEGLRRALEGRLQQATTAAGPPAPIAVLALTDELALAAETVLKAQGLGRDRVRLFCVGGADATLARLRDPDGLLAATLAIPYELLGEGAADALDDLMAGTPRAQIAPGPYLYVEPVLVDRDNVPGPDELPW